jgi:hypothetical protein
MFPTSKNVLDMFFILCRWSSVSVAGPRSGRFFWGLGPGVSLCVF